MGNSGEKRCVSISNFTGSCFDLYLNESPIFFFDDTVYPVVIYKRQINIKPLHEHLANKVVFHPFAEASGMSERNSHHTVL